MSDLATLNVGTYDLVIEQGATFRKNFLVHNADATPFDLTGFTGRAQARLHGTLLVDFTVTIDVPTGTVSVYASPTQTATLPVAADIVWDLKLTAGSESSVLVRGSVTVEPEVTT